MSLHVIRGREPRIRVVAGWDNLLETFFCVVEDWRPAPDERDPVILAVGVSPYEVCAAEELACLAAEYASFDPAMIRQLWADRSCEVAQAPSPIHRVLRAARKAKTKHR